MNVPQIVMICLFVVTFVVSVMKHGQNRGPHSMWWSLFAIGIWIALLWWGGFWK